MASTSTPKTSQGTPTRTALTRLFKAVTPPALANAARWALGSPPVRFRGHFESWDEARRRSTGYDAAAILEKVEAASLEVKAGRAACERDSVLFDTIQYPFPILAVLLRSAQATDGCLSVLDFGGALGSSYYQCREFLSPLRHIRWCVVEQPGFVERGRQVFEDDALKFYPSIAECLRLESPRVALLSGVLQYLEKPSDVLRELAERRLDYLIVDRTPFSFDDRTTLSVQIVSSAVYSASYPVWIFAPAALRRPLETDYRLLAEFDAIDGVIGNGRTKACFKGMIFERTAARPAPQDPRAS